MKFTTTRMEFRFDDTATGYGFDVVAILDYRRGWVATVTLSSGGMMTPHGALESLRPAIEELLRQLREYKP